VPIVFQDTQQILSSFPYSQLHYKRILFDVKNTIDHLDDILRGQALKNYRRSSHVIEGLVWWHGYSDFDNDDNRDAYPENLKAFMSDIRKDLQSPFL
jgi:hypothetical protein